MSSGGWGEGQEKGAENKGANETEGWALITLQRNVIGF